MPSIQAVCHRLSVGQWTAMHGKLHIVCLAFHWQADQCALVTAGRQAAVCSCSACPCQSGRHRPQHHPSWHWGASCSFAASNHWRTSCSLASWQVTAACTASKMLQHPSHMYCIDYCLLLVMFSAMALTRVFVLFCLTCSDSVVRFGYVTLYMVLAL